MSAARKPILVTDLDGCIYDFCGALYSFIEKRFGVQFAPEDLSSYDIFSLMKHSKAEKLSEAARSNMDYEVRLWIQTARCYWDMRPIEGSQYAIRKLSEVADVLFMTGRPVLNGIHKVTLLAVARDFPEIRDGSFCHPKRKGTTAKGMRARWAIEDLVPSAEGYARHRIMTFVIRSPYMGDCPRSKFLRPVASVAEVAEIITSRYSPAEEHINA